MAYTKREFLTAAFLELGMADYVFDISPEALSSALPRLDGMMTVWEGRGIRLGYPLPSSPSSSDVDADTGVPDFANEAIITNLAIRLAPSFGKAINPATKAVAKEAYDSMLSRFSTPPQMQLSYLPAGAGHKPIWGSEMFLPAPVDNLQSGNDGTLTFE